MLYMSLIIISLSCYFTSFTFKLYWDNLVAMVSKLVVCLTNFLITFQSLGWGLVMYIQTVLEVLG